MTNRLAVIGAFFGLGLAVACSSAPSGQGQQPTPDSGPSTCGGDCQAGTHLVDQGGGNCSCVPDNPNCADPGICGQGLHWDFVACSCQPDNKPHCDPTPCPFGSEWDPYKCACIGEGGPPPPACFIPGYGECYFGQTCVVAYCPDSSPLTCYCDPQRGAVCGGTCPSPPPPWDGGPPPPWDAGPPPPWDAGPQPDSGPSGCWLPGAGYCPAYTSCFSGYCPDNVTPIFCYCEGNGVSQCAGACSPNVDAGWRD